MRKFCILPLAVAFFYTQAFAQITNYSFSASSGTYTPITGTVIPVTDIQNGVSALRSIGFNFVYNGITYSEFGASTNGKIRLGAVLSSGREAGQDNMSDYPERPILAPLWDHLALSAQNGLTSEVSGTAPNRVLTIQWAQVEWSYIEVTPGIEFQLKLFETSNHIEFIYNRLPGSVFGPFATIGITAVDEGEGNY